MDQLNVVAAWAEIFSAATIVFGGVFGVFQLVEFRRRRKYQIAAELCRKFSDPEFGRAITLIRNLPDGVSTEELKAMPPDYEESAQIVGMAFETMGLLVHMNLASFQLIQQLTGGLLLMTWRKLGNWIIATRIESGNPRFAEWVQWLAERVAEEERTIQPAFEAYAEWRPSVR